MANKELANVEQQLADEAASIADSIGKPATNVIKVRDKVFTLPDGQVLQQPLRVVILEFVSKNFFYEEAYREGEVASPVCFAINKVVSSMAPSPNATDPQSETCQTCPMNEFGSDGRGKACKNTRAIAVTLCDSDDETIYTINVSPTAIKAFDAYVGAVAKMYKAPPVRVETEISFHPEKTFPSLIFSNPQPNEMYKEDFARRNDALDMLMIEPQIEVAAEEDKPAKTTRRTTKKKTARRKS